MTPPLSGHPSPPAHHLPEHGLVEYVAGACTDGAALAFACHLSLCASCATEVTALERVGGTILETSAGQELCARRAGVGAGPPGDDTAPRRTAGRDPRCPRFSLGV